MNKFGIIERVKNPSINAVYYVYKYINAKNKITQFMYKKVLVDKYNIYIFNDVKIGEGLKLPHPTGIVIGKGAVIGNNVTIYQQVTIGGKNIGDTKAGRIALVKDNAVLFTGVKVLGAVTIGENSSIGANAVVLSDTEDNSVYAGVPAKRIR